MRNTIAPHQTKRFLPAFSVVVLGLALGCGGGTGGGLPEGSTGTVSGKVTFKGQSVPDGATVIFIHKERGFTASGAIQPDGSFSLKMRGGSDILVGPYQVGVTPPTVELTPAQEEAINLGTETFSEKEWPEIPEKYRTPESSGETFEVKEGANTYSLDMLDGETAS